MNFKTIISFIISLLIGVLFGNLILSQYKHNIIQYSKTDYPIYLIQQGVYSTEESMEENTVDLSDFMYVKQDDKYYVYLGVTHDIDTANIIKDNYNIDLYIKENWVDNEELLVKIKENDNLINENSNKSDILSISKKSLEIYEGQMNLLNEH